MFLYQLLDLSAYSTRQIFCASQGGLLFILLTIKEVQKLWWCSFEKIRMAGPRVMSIFVSRMFIEERWHSR